MRITVIGSGYVGLVVGTCFAENGHFVTCVDTDADRIAALKAGQMPIYEPGLEELVARNIEEDRLTFTTDTAQGVRDCLLVFLCVGTPPGADGQADISHVIEAAEAAAKAMTGYRIFVNKSTCPVGTADVIRETVSRLTSHPFDVVVNPEFLKEGAAVDDFMRPDRVVVGCDDVRVQEIMKELYQPFLRTGKPFIAMSIRSAEMAKYAMNVMLAARISLMNELAGICGAYDADVTQVQEALMADGRIGASYLFPGLGFGGSCLPKDVKACSQLARLKGLGSDMLDAVDAVNEKQKHLFAQRIIDHFGDAICEKRVAIWGASFKPKTDDIREAPSLTVINALLDAGASVVVYDPVAQKSLQAHYGDRIDLVPKSYDAVKGADALVIVTEWREFHFPDFDRIGELMRERVVFDGRNLYKPKQLSEKGFRYISIGRPAV